jgi:SRSO17 transposase
MGIEEQLDKTPLTGDISEFKEPIIFHQVNDSTQDSLWNSLVQTYHYLGYESVIGGRIKYLITLGKLLIGAISFCSGAYKLGPRDQFVGWDEPTKRQYLAGLLNNNRFLILPWIKIHNLASKLLSLSLKLIYKDWKKQYGVEPSMVETFIDLEKYRGTCYIAANWTYLGLTKGFKRIGNTFVYHGNEKGIFVRVISRRFNNSFRPNVDRVSNERKEILAQITGAPANYQATLKGMDVAEMDRESYDQLLADHLHPYLPYLNRKEVRKSFITTVIGYLSDLDNKTSSGISRALSEKNQGKFLSNFLHSTLFDDQGMLKEYQKELASFLFHPEGMITGDSYFFSRKGTKTVGVDYQYNDNKGEFEICQASVMTGYSSPRGYGLLDSGLYVPERWFTADLQTERKKCLFPEDIKYVSKNELLLRLIQNSVRSGFFQGKYVGVSSCFGKDQLFIDCLPANLIYFADVPEDYLVFKSRPKLTVQGYKGMGKKPLPKPTFPPCPVEEIVRNSDSPWTEVVLGLGTEGLILAKDKCVKVVESRDGEPRKDIWLYAMVLPDGSARYSICNESMDAGLAKLRQLALGRWSVKQGLMELKKYMGLGQTEVRSWPGFRRHVLLTFIAHFFMSKLRQSPSRVN